MNLRGCRTIVLYDWGIAIRSFPPSPLMYIWVAAGKRNNGAGAAGGPGPLGAGRLCKEHGSVGQALWLVISFPWQKQQRKDRACLYILDIIGRKQIEKLSTDSSAGAPPGRCRSLLRGAVETTDRSASAWHAQAVGRIWTETTTARLCVFAALHDIGKVNIGFQARIWRPEDLPPNGAKNRRAWDMSRTLCLCSNTRTKRRPIGFSTTLAYLNS